MSDRELLERAARAAGFETIPWETADIGFVIRNAEGYPQKWNPREDDGDALRLAVTMGLEIRQVHNKAHCGWPGKFWKTEAYGSDKNDATRRAIVRAAAEMAPEVPA